MRLKRIHRRRQDRIVLTRAFNVHEVGVGRLHKTLELVLLGFVLVGGVEEIDSESLRRRCGQQQQRRRLVHTYHGDRFCFLGAKYVLFGSLTL